VRAGSPARTSGILLGMRYFVGITGASGAPYAARLLDGLNAAGAEIGVCASASAGEVIAYEVYRDRSLDPAAAVRRFVDEHGGPNATLYGERDWFSPYASGSARCDGYVICPCSMATIGTIASSGQANLIHRAAGVALKEDRRLVLVPRETPLSVIHLQAMLTLRQAGALMLPAMPAFYTLPESLDDIVDFVAGKALDLLGVEHDLLRRWGQDRSETT
jgi:flavin prenyltransferase